MRRRGVGEGGDGAPEGVGLLRSEEGVGALEVLHLDHRRTSERTSA